MRRESYNNDRDMMISNLKLIKTISNDACFKEIILLKDGRLCAMDKENTIRIYDIENYNCQITIKINEKITEGDYHLASIDNYLVVVTDNYIEVIKIINSSDYDIIHKFSIEPNYSVHYSSVYTIDNKIYFNNCCIEKIGKEFILKESDKGDPLYIEKCKFMDWNIEFWTIDEEHSFIFLISEKNNEKKRFITPYFTNSLTRNQKLLIEPSYVILGQDEFLFDLNEKEDIYMIHSKEDHIIQKNAFRKGEDSFKYYTNFYQSLSKNSFIYLNTYSNSYLYQIDIIKKESSLDFEINSTREDIKGQFFILEGKILFVLNGNKIFIYHF